MLRKIAVFPNDNNPDTNQWPIDPMDRPASHGGAEFPLKLGAAEVALIRLVNSNDIVPIDKKIQWAVRNVRGGIYYAEKQDAQGNDLLPWWWASVIMGSGPTAAQTNIVNVLETSRGKARIETIPLRDNYEGYSPSTHPHLFHRVLVTNSRGCFDSPAGVFWMPLFEGKFRKKSGVEYNGMWVRSAYLGDAVDAPPVEPPAAVYVVALRKTVIRQRPDATSPKSGNGVLLAGAKALYIADAGDWVQIDGGYVIRKDVRIA